MLHAFLSSIFIIIFSTETYLGSTSSVFYSSEYVKVIHFLPTVFSK